MATPRELLHRAEAGRPRPVAPQPIASQPIPVAPGRPAPVAPRPMSAAPVHPAPEPQKPPEQVMVAQPIHTNSVYRQLMRSHDRMHTRHLQG